MRIGRIHPCQWGAVARPVLLGACVVFWPACSENVQPPDTPEDTSDALFDATRRVEFGIELAPADWESLRLQGRSMTAVLSAHEPYEYTEFDATVTIDGTRYEHVSVRKKGFLASLSATRPSLKLDLDDEIEGQNHLGFKNFTLNNDRQDPSHTHQVMAYRMFSHAGVPAPRCGLAHVVVNGEDLGTYSNVETVNKSFLKRHFTDNDGNLYEGQASDFTAETVQYMELKTNETENDRSDILALTETLKAEDDSLVQALSAEIDLENFRTFWAMETLIGHWDSYSGNANNYFAYRDPASQRFVFMPWGTDSAFEVTNPFVSAPQSPIVYATGRIANRLYKIPAERELYRARLGELNDSLWNVDSLLGEVAQIESLAPDAFPARVALQRTLIQSRGQLIREALTQPSPEWQDVPSVIPNPCLGMITSVSGSFDTTFGNLQELLPGASELKLNLDGKELVLPWLARAGFGEDGGPDPRIRYATQSPDGRLLVVDLLVPLSQLGPGSRPFHGLETSGLLMLITGQGPIALGLMGEGTIEFTEASAIPGSRVAGSLTGRVLQFMCVEF